MSRIINSIGIKGYKVLNQTAKADFLEIDLQALSKRPKACIRCGSRSLQSKGPYTRYVRHLESFGRSARLKIRCRRFRCKSCVRSFVEPLPGVLPGRHSSEPFRENIYTLHTPRRHPQFRDGPAQKRSPPQLSPASTLGLQSGKPMNVSLSISLCSRRP